LARVFPMKWVFAGIQLLGMIGCVLYAFAAYPINAPWVIIAARTFAGLGYGGYALGLSYMGIVIQNPTERAAVIGNFRAVGIFGSIPSSLVAIVLAIPAIAFSVGPYEFNSFTYPAWATFFVEFVALVGIVLFVQHSPEEAILRSESLTLNNPEGKPSGASSKKIFISTGVVLALLIFFYDGYLVSTISYTMPVVMIDGYNWSVIQYSPVVLLLSIVGTVSALFSKTIGKKLKAWQHIVVIPSLGYIVLMCVVAIMGTPSVGLNPLLGAFLFLFAVETMFFAFEILQTVLSTVFSLILPREFIVRMMPISSGMYSIGKIIGPLISKYESSLYGIPLIFYVLLVVTGGLFAIVLCFSHHFYTGAGYRTEVLEDEKVEVLDARAATNSLTF